MKTEAKPADQTNPLTSLNHPRWFCLKDITVERSDLRLTGLDWVRDRFSPISWGCEVNLLVLSPGINIKNTALRDIFEHLKHQKVPVKVTHCKYSTSCGGIDEADEFKVYVKLSDPEKLESIRNQIMGYFSTGSFKSA